MLLRRLWKIGVMIIMSKIDELAALNYIANLKVDVTFRVKDNMGAKKMIPAIKQALIQYNKMEQGVLDMIKKYTSTITLDDLMYQQLIKGFIENLQSLLKGNV